MLSQEREAALFAFALDQPKAKRSEFLDFLCEGDSAMRARLEARLAAQLQADTLVAAQAQTGRFTEKAEGIQELVDEAVGQTIGRYRLLEKIGEGGFGVVYVAEQKEPVKRRVAMKIIKLGMDTRQVVARFEAERQALAMMDHPNIAKVLDAASTDRGRPYFVMELVRGIKITNYCDQNNLSTQERLELFQQVCHAIQHAHQKGIIHRDVKPSNILVTLHDGVPVPKVIDFGVAKATQQPLTEKTLFTALEQVVGTPAYMSPEQAEVSGLDIDTRADIYSLGVLLYELLTGRLPFEAKDFLQAGLDEMRRVIREEDPPRPSVRLSTLAAPDLTKVAKHRHAAPPKLINLIRGDLDWIVMKALEKDRTRRYETANGLAMDIKRHLGHEPVIARPPNMSYRFQKVVRRNKLLFAAASAIAMALLAGLCASTWLFLQERRARLRAVAAERQERVLREEMRESMAREAKLLVDVQANRTRAEILEKVGNLSDALEAIRAALRIHPQDPGLWTTQGRMLEKANRIDDAYQSLTKAIELSGGQTHPPGEAQVRSYFARSSFLRRQNRLVEAARDFCLIKHIPSRDPRAQPEQLDLTLYYNASLTESWEGDYPNNDLAALPRGLQTLASVPFDIRGLIQLARTSPIGEEYPKKVEGIPVGRVCRRLHFLHSALHAATATLGTQIGIYSINYANDQRREIPIVIGQDVGDWWNYHYKENAQFVTAWEGTNGASGKYGSVTVRLFKTTWENPSTNSEVRSIDFSWAAPPGIPATPFLVAVTVE